MSEINTSGTNFSGGLPKVSAGDSLTYDLINNLSAYVQASQVRTSVGGIVRRGTGGTSVVANEPNSYYPPFTVWITEGYVAMFIGNIWYGKNSSEDIRRLVYWDSEKKIPWMNVECKIKGKEFTSEAPYVLTFPIKKETDAIVYIDADITTPEIKYDDIETVEGRITADPSQYFIPIAYIDSKENVVQITSGDIWLGDLYKGKSHPFRVYAKGTSQVGVEYGSVFTYGKDEFLDIGTTNYPNAVKIEGGDKYLTKEKGGSATFNVKNGDSIYLKFERDGNKDTDTATWTDYGKATNPPPPKPVVTKWKVTLCAGTMGTGLIYGNYNIIHQDPPCGVDGYHKCEDETTSTLTVRIPNSGGGGEGGGAHTHTDLFIQSTSKSYGGKMFSYGTIYYEIAKIKVESVKNPETGKDDITISPDQRLRSDFFFYPPLDNQYGFTDTYVSAFGLGTALPAGDGSGATPPE